MPRIRFPRPGLPDRRFPAVSAGGVGLGRVPGVRATRGRGRTAPSSGPPRRRASSLTRSAGADIAPVAAERGPTERVCLESAARGWCAERECAGGRSPARFRPRDPMAIKPGHLDHFSFSFARRRVRLGPGRRARPGSTVESVRPIMTMPRDGGPRRNARLREARRGRLGSWRFCPAGFRCMLPLPGLVADLLGALDRPGWREGTIPRSNRGHARRTRDRPLPKSRSAEADLPRLRVSAAPPLLP